MADRNDELREILKRMQSDPDFRATKMAEMDARVTGLANYVMEHYSHNPSTAISALALVLSEVIKASGGGPQTLVLTMEAITMYSVVPITRYIDKEKMEPRKPS
jgi:hypothetical protein